VYLDQSINDFAVDNPVFGISSAIIVCNANIISYRASHRGSHRTPVTRAPGEAMQEVVVQSMCHLFELAAQNVAWQQTNVARLSHCALRVTSNS
jgi:hypothetical protein